MARYPYNNDYNDPKQDYRIRHMDPRWYEDRPDRMPPPPPPYEPPPHYHPPKPIKPRPKEYILDEEGTNTNTIDSNIDNTVNKIYGYDKDNMNKLRIVAQLINQESAALELINDLSKPLDLVELAETCPAMNSSFRENLNQAYSAQLKQHLKLHQKLYNYIYGSASGETTEEEDGGPLYSINGLQFDVMEEEEKTDGE